MSMTTTCGASAARAYAASSAASIRLDVNPDERSMSSRRGSVVRIAIWVNSATSLTDQRNVDEERRLGANFGFSDAHQTGHRHQASDDALVVGAHAFDEEAHDVADR